MSIKAALTNSVVVASFGDGEEAVSVHRVHPEGAEAAKKNEELDRRDRIAAGKTLARSDALLMSTTPRELVVDGRVDARILLSLQRLRDATHDEVVAGPHKRFPDNPFTP